MLFISLDVVLSFMIFHDLVFMFIFKTNKIILFKKKR